VQLVTGTDAEQDHEPILFWVAVALHGCQRGGDLLIGYFWCAFEAGKVKVKPQSVSGTLRR
jgi:hypothetical protein